MKICPRCQKTYVDENLNFCLEDGSVLTQAAAPPPQTFQMNEPRVTQPQPSQPLQMNQPAQQAGWNTPQYSMQPPKKSSKTWVWVLLILGAVVLLCGGGGAALLFFAANADVTTNTANTVANNSAPANKGTNATTPTGDTSSRTSVENVSFSKWVPDSPKYADVEFTDGELLVKNKEKGFYYVLAGTDKQMSVDADSRVTVRNVENADTNLGFGLVFHSKPTPLQQGYALLIDSKKKRYRVVHHTPGDEEAVVDWKRSDAILDGTQSNTLEARDKTGTVDLYINGKKVETIKNTFGYSAGVIGIYSSGGLQIAFKDMQIRK
ncbi:hypothetical protein BH10ACI3_BH10ACI3_03930 [soil metagenome]